MLLIKIELAVNEPIHLQSGKVVGVRLSMGVCLYSPDFSSDFDTLLRYADQALYRAKANKRQRSRYWELFTVEDRPADAGKARDPEITRTSPLGSDEDEN